MSYELKSVAGDKLFGIPFQLRGKTIENVDDIRLKIDTVAKGRLNPHSLSPVVHLAGTVKDLTNSFYDGVGNVVAGFTTSADDYRWNVLTLHHNLFSATGVADQGYAVLFDLYQDRFGEPVLRDKSSVVGTWRGSIGFVYGPGFEAVRAQLANYDVSNFWPNTAKSLASVTSGLDGVTWRPLEAIVKEN